MRFIDTKPGTINFQQNVDKDPLQRGFIGRPNVLGLLVDLGASDELDIQNKTLQSSSPWRLELQSAAGATISIAKNTASNAGSITIDSVFILSEWSFIGCGEVPAGPTYDNCTFTNCVAAQQVTITNQAEFDSKTNCLFSSNSALSVLITGNHGGEVWSANNLRFINGQGSYDIEYTGTGTLAIALDSQSVLSQARCIATGGGAIVVINNAQITITGIPDGLEARARRGSVSLSHQQSVTGGSFVYTYQYSGDIPVTISIGGVDNLGAAYQRRQLQLLERSFDQVIPFDAELHPSYKA